MVKVDEDLVKSFEELVRKTNSFLEDVRSFTEGMLLGSPTEGPNFLALIEIERFKGKDKDEDSESLYIRAHESEEIVNWLECVFVCSKRCEGGREKEAKQLLKRSANMVRKWMLFDTALRGKRSKFYSEIFSEGD